jgi:hypothetical protein
MPTTWALTQTPHSSAKPSGILARFVSFLPSNFLEDAAVDRDDARTRIEHEHVERRRAARGLGLADLVHGEQRRQLEVDVVLLLEQRHTTVR